MTNKQTLDELELSIQDAVTEMFADMGIDVISQSTHNSILALAKQAFKRNGLMIVEGFEPISDKHKDLTKAEEWLVANKEHPQGSTAGWWYGDKEPPSNARWHGWETYYQGEPTHAMPIPELTHE